MPQASVAGVILMPFFVSGGSAATAEGAAVFALPFVWASTSLALPTTERPRPMARTAPKTFIAFISFLPPVSGEQPARSIEEPWRDDPPAGTRTVASASYQVNRFRRTAPAPPHGPVHLWTGALANRW